VGRDKSGSGGMCGISIHFVLYSVILSTYNEKENLPIIFSLLLDKTFSEHKLDYQVVVVEDNSPNGTLQVAESNQDHKMCQKVGIRVGLSGWTETSGWATYADLSHHPK
jgi:hypothetical protein